MGSWHQQLLENYIRETGRSFASIAAEIGVDKSTVSRWYSGASEIRAQYHPLIESLADLPKPTKNSQACPLKGIFCPIFDGKELDHIVAVTIKLMCRMNPDQRRAMLKKAEQIIKQSP